MRQLTYMECGGRLAYQKESHAITVQAVSCYITGILYTAECISLTDVLVPTKGNVRIKKLNIWTSWYELSLPVTIVLPNAVRFFPRDAGHNCDSDD